MDNKVSEIFEGLNEEQKGAVSQTEGPVLIVAGAGSGKTKVLTCRVANILAKGEKPERILALTFTKKAAGEMKERIGVMVGEKKARRVVMGTFHAVFVRFLREWAEYLGYPLHFTIYDTGDSQSAVKACIKELGLDDKVYKPKAVLSRISGAKNSLVSVSSYRNNTKAIMNDTKNKMPRLIDIYAAYQEKLRSSGVMDFDDILFNMYELLSRNADARRELGSRFGYIMVDEYQDTNKVQYEILKLLACGNPNICVVGDDSQSIYAFRGARVRNILDFQKDYPDCKIFRLERNYRSTRTIVDAANTLIEKNENRIPKVCRSEGEQGELIAVESAYNEQNEAARVVSDILCRLREDHATYQDFAILYRTNSQSRPFEEALRARNLPYMIYSGNSFFERAEVKDLMAYFKLVVNINDDESFKRIVNKPARGIGDTSLAALFNAAHANGMSLFKAAWAENLEMYGLKAAAIKKIREFVTMIDALAAKVAGTDADFLAKEIADKSGLYASFKQENSVEGESRASNVEELVNSVATFVEEQKDEDTEGVVTLGDYLENVSLLSNADTSDDEDAANRIALMTVHSSKGLEFPYVFIVGLEENLFPSGGMLALPTDIEEERRLMYVALTRAKRSVTLTYATERMRNGKRENNTPSRFLREIDPEYLDLPESFEADARIPAFGGFGSSFSGFGSSFGKGSGYGPASGGTAFGGRAGNGASSFGRSSGSGRSSEGGYSRSGASSGQPNRYTFSGAGRSGGSQPGSAYGNAGRYGGDSSGRQGSSAGRFGVDGRQGAGSSAGRFGCQDASSASPRPQMAAKPAIIDPNFVPVPMTELKAGQRIEHNRFGGGLILEITGTAPELKAKIRFDDYGEKLLLLKYAKIRFEK